MTSHTARRVIIFVPCGQSVRGAAPSAKGGVPIEARRGTGLIELSLCAASSSDRPVFRSFDLCSSLRLLGAPEVLLHFLRFATATAAAKSGGKALGSPRADCQGRRLFVCLFSFSRSHVCFAFAFFARKRTNERFAAIVPLFLAQHGVGPRKTKKKKKSH